MTQSDLTQRQTVSKLIDRSISASLIAEVLLAVAVFGFLGYVFSNLEGLSQFKLTPRAPTQASWHPDSSFYCGAVHSLNPNLPDEFSVDLVADSAPTLAAHNAAVVLYNDIANLRPTTTDFNTLVAAYPCPVS